MIGRYEIGSKMRINMNAFCMQQNWNLFWRYKKYLGIDLCNSTITRMPKHYIQIFALIFHRWCWCTIFDKKSTSKRDYKNGLVLSNVLCQFIYLALSINSIDISIYAISTYYTFDYDILGAILFCKCDDVFLYLNMKYITDVKTFI